MHPLLPFAHPYLLQYGWNPNTYAIIIVGDQQRLFLIQHDLMIASWPVSTAALGFGNQNGSQQTPTGMHRICACIGENAPLGTIFKARVATNDIILHEEPQADYITSRILWLDGLEPGINQQEQCDSRSRYIYIHGTPHTSLLGSPASHGCIRMSNENVCQLFTYVQENTLVLILPDHP